MHESRARAWPAPTSSAVAAPTPFVQHLAEVGISAHVETETLGFDHENFVLAWDVLAGTTATDLAPERQLEARDAVKDWGIGRSPAQRLVGYRSSSSAR